MATELEALNQISFRSYVKGEDIWRSGLVVVDSLHKGTRHEINRSYCELKKGDSPANIVMEGRAGAGKTHVLACMRQMVMEGGDIFILVQPSSARKFWDSVVNGYLDSLFRQRADGRRQISSLADSLLKLVQTNHIIDCTALTPKDVLFLRPLLRCKFGRGLNKRNAVDVAVALLLLHCEDYGAQDIGEAFLRGLDLEPDSQRRFGFRVSSLPAQEVVAAIDLMIGEAGKVTFLAIDQLDGLIAIASGSGSEELDLMANGLMDLAQQSQYTLVVLSCLPTTWRRVREFAVQSAAARFPVHLSLDPIPSPEIAKQLIAAYFREAYERVDFVPPYPAWPIKPAAFDNAEDLFSPRELLEVADRHIRKCRQDGAVQELASLLGTAEQDHSISDVTPSASGRQRQSTIAVLADISQGDVEHDLTVEFETARKHADSASALHDQGVDDALPPLLACGLACWVDENPDSYGFQIDRITGRNPALHARLRSIIDQETEMERHWSFRAVMNQNATAALNRLRAAITEAGLDLGHEKRQLIILRNHAFSTGQKTQEVIGDFERLGGRILRLTAEDVATFAGLKALRDAHGDAVLNWLRAVRPASKTTLFSEVFGDFLTTPRKIEDAAAPNLNKPTSRQRSDLAITLGRSHESDQPIMLPLENLRRHMAIFAGSGSGKTVLIRRLVEECALQGVSSIVLDTNNDLARLASPWPEPPQWPSGDAQRAQRYFAKTDVVIWTPGCQNGRPLSFQPLGDLAASLDDPDAFNSAIDAAIASLLPRTGLPISGAKSEQGRAVLKQALMAYVRQGNTGLRPFVDFLANLPADISSLDTASNLANTMAQTLLAATVNDPLFGGAGEAMDPGVLFQPAYGKQARISVINFIGLQQDAQRQNFVNQLQLALFAWVKRNPAADKPLGGLFVMDEAQTFAPSSPATPCTQSTLALAQQARKYGLGLVFATQAPKALHNRIAGNATTQFYGLLNAPAQIHAVREIAAAKGSDVQDIARLQTGTFYITGEGLPLQKIATPLCLSHHPQSPLTETEVLNLAKPAS